MHHQFIQNHRSEFGVNEMCECLDIKRSSYYARRARPPSRRATEDEAFKTRISELYGQAKGRYGHRPIYHNLREEQMDCGRDRVLRLMQELGIAGKQCKGSRPLGTNSKHGFGYSANLLKQLGAPQRSDQVWVADTTYLRTNNGWSYLATVMDLFSRRIIGWSVSERNDSELACQALRGAVLGRGGLLPKGLLHHSDRGSTYAGHDYTKLLSRFGITQSMRAKGNCYDNAAQESFYGRYKSSSVRNRIFASKDEAQSNAFEYIEVFYNRFRKYSSLGYKSPVEFEQNFCPHGGNDTSLPACLNNN